MCRTNSNNGGNKNSSHQRNDSLNHSGIGTPAKRDYSSSRERTTSSTPSRPPVKKD